MKNSCWLIFLFCLGIISCDAENASTKPTDSQAEASKTLPVNASEVYASKKAKELDSKRKMKDLKFRAEEGDVDASYSIAVSYLKESDKIKEAENWLRKAASKGHPPSLHALGRMYLLGIGVDKNMEEAKAYFHLSAGAGYAPSENALGAILLENSEGNLDMEKRAVTYLSRAADKGEANAAILLATKAMQEEDYDIACSWYEKGSSANHPVGHLGMGLCHGERLFSGSSDAKAEFYYKQAASSGVVEAQLNLGQLYEKGWSGNNPDPDEALKWYVLASKAGNKLASFNAGRVYARVKEDYVSARRFLERSSDLGYAPAQHELAVLYGKGAFGNKNHNKSFYFYKKAAEGGYIPSQFQLGLLYLNSKLETFDQDKAKLWLEKAKNAGHQKSRMILDRLSAGEKIEFSDYDHHGHKH